MQNIELNIYRGDDAAFVLSVFDEDNSPLDLSNCELKMEMLPSVVSEGRLAMPSKNIHVATNKITLNFPHEMTRDWVFRSAIFDVQCTDSDGLVQTLVCGRIVVKKDVTQ